MDLKETFVYVIASDQSPNQVKIGMSRDPSRRVKQLQTGHATLLQVFHKQAFPAKNTRMIEQIIHKNLGHLKLKGEWFSLTVEEAIAEVEFALIRYGDETYCGLKWL